ncbi:uncharacterized protein LACBIDRAFT_329795 [Laccaria bicolor S238N-H82]|uniref:Predicted protein n=1 Tax=Laccaria bicolor (strain S238N-H82 / ATCC MYA-4686) TaxID=486041 RepID=B0DJ94_LACBS|nr:uncharacterized protein LACBIDRAFT_329795 [Laccaria bicolor S238N-H82]EDR05363.1 predicted protein [Laccaria bicolor S238N-H82]|eukprot:XP_001883921.1 predicted protein [Laccaria bicolor S238N-H82]
MSRCPRNGGTLNLQSTPAQPPAAASQNTQNPLNPQPRVPRTHTSPAIIQLLKNLSLPNILQKNKGIDAENDARSAKTLNNALDPVAHPQPGSEVASLITIDPEDLARLRVPSKFMAYLAENLVLNWL